MRKLRQLPILVALLFLAPRTFPAGEIWDGGGGNDNWTTGANWNTTGIVQVPPPNNGTANIHMAGNQGTTNVVDVPWSINSLTFDNGSSSFFVTGQELTIGLGGIMNNDNSNQFVSAPVRLAADQTWNAAAGLLAVSPINLNGFDLTFGGAFNTTLSGPISGSGILTLPDTYTATVTMSGNASNTYTGTTAINAGTLLLSKTSGAVAIPGGLEVSGTVRLGGNEQISHAPGTPDVVVDPGGLLHLDGHDETVTGILMRDAVISTGAGRLILGTRMVGRGTVVGNIDLGGGQPFFNGLNGTIELDGPISNGSVTLAGVTLLGPSNTYIGLTNVSGRARLNKAAIDGAFRGDVHVAGIVELQASEQILAAPGNVLDLQVGRLEMGAFSETIQDLVLRNSADITGTSGTLTVLGSITVPGEGVQSRIEANLNLAGIREFAIELDGDSIDSDLDVSGMVSNGSIVKNGTGSMRLSNVGNTYAGGTFINEGTVIAHSDSSLGAAASAIQINGGVLGTDGLNFTTTSRTITLGSGGGGFEITRIEGVFTVPTQSLSGTGSLTKLGPGKLVMFAPQTYTGGTTVAAGTLEGNTQSLQGNIVNNSTLVFNQATDGPYGGNLSGSGVLSKLGAGALQLTGNNTYSGATTVNAGALRLAGGNAIGDLSPVSLTNGAAVLLDLAGSNETIGSLAGGGTNGGNVDLGSGTLTTGGNNTNTTFAGVISGTGAVVKTGAGIWTLTGNNTYTGGTTFAGGVTSASSDANLGNAAGPLRFDGGTLRVTGAYSTTPRSVELLAGGGGLDIANTANSFTYSGNITGPGGLTKVGTGTLVLQGNNTYGGPTTVNAGTLRAELRGAIPDTSAVTLANVAGVLLDLDAAETIGSLSGGGPAGGDVSVEAATLTTGGDNSSTTFAGSISGSGGLVKRGLGVFTLAGNNTYSGLTTVEQGTLRLGSVTGVPDNNAVQVAAGATLDLNNFDKTLSRLTGDGLVTLGAGDLTLNALGGLGNTFAGQLSGTGSLAKTGDGTLDLNGANSYTGGTSVLAGRLRGPAAALQGNIVNQATVEFSQSSNGAYTGALSGPGQLVKTGTGKLTIASPATYTGTTTISQGALAVANTLNTPGGAIQIQSGGVLEASGVIQRAISGAGALTATGNLVAGDITSTSGFQAGAVNVGGHAVVLLDADRAHIGGGTIAGGSLTSLAGLELTAGNFAGHGTINGAFINNATVAGPPAPQALSFAGPLSGAGSFTGNIRILDSFSPGNSPAAVTLEDVAFGPDSVLSMELAGVIPGTQYDTLTVSGIANLDGVLNVSLDPFWLAGPQFGDQFDLLTAAVLQGSFNRLQLPALSGELHWRLDQTTTSLTLTVIPEPTSLVLLMLACLALAAQFARRKPISMSV